MSRTKTHEQAKEKPRQIKRRQQTERLLVPARRAPLFPTPEANASWKPLG